MPIYQFYTDPGHGWLRVPIADLPPTFFPSVAEHHHTDNQSPIRNKRRF